VVFGKHTQLASLQNKKELVTNIFVILCKSTESKKNMQSNKEFFLWW
jgi:hypothetical protein